MAHHDIVERLQRAGRAVGSVSAGTSTYLDSVGRMLAEHTPELLAQLRLDSAADAFAQWGLSTVLDENLDEPVVSRPLFDFLHAEAGLEARWPVGNAGLLHVYGYLLSTVETAYGLKRERWVGTDLSRALALPDGAFLDRLTAARPTAGGLVSFVGAVLRGILTAAGGDGRGRAGSGDAEAAAAEPADAEAAGAESAGAGSAASAIALVVDEFAGEEREEIARAVLVRTGDHRALVYAIVTGSESRLVTAFPVAATEQSWLETFTREPPRLRYNAAAHELPARAPLAERRVHVVAQT